MNGKLTTFQRVRELTGWRAVAFSATLLERMLPNYHLFCEANAFADPQVYRRVLDRIWEHVAATKGKINFSAQLQNVEEGIPEVSDFDNFGVYPAVDACMAFVATLQLIMGEEPQGAVIVSKLSQGSVEAVIDATEEIEPQHIKAHPLMSWEIEFQVALLDQLAQSRHADIDALKRMACEEGVSNIGISIE